MFGLDYLFFIILEIITFLFLATNYIIRHVIPWEYLKKNNKEEETTSLLKKKENNIFDIAFLVFAGIHIFLWILNFIWFLVVY